MIKLELPEKPIQLTDEIEKELTEQFKKNGTAVWDKAYIKEPLLTMSNYNTIEAVALNDRVHFVTPRADSAFLIIDLLSAHYKLLLEVKTDRKRNNAINRIKSILEQCGPQHEFSAAISTYLLYEDPLFQEIKSYLISIEKWDKQFQQIEAELTRIALPPFTE